MLETLWPPPCFVLLYSICNYNVLKWKDNGNLCGFEAGLQSEFLILVDGWDFEVIGRGPRDL